jgi:hypothetical protein
VKGTTMKKLLAILLLAFSLPAFGTVPAADSHIEYPAAGVGPYTFPFRTNSAADIDVFVGGVPRESGVTIWLDPVSPGGTVTFTGAAPTGIVRIERNVPLAQATVWNAGAPFNAKTIERAFDNLVMQAQQIDREQGDERGRNNDQDVIAAEIRADLTEEASLRVSGDNAEFAERVAGDASTAANAAAALAAEASVRAAADEADRDFATTLVNGVLAGTGAVPQTWSATGDGAGMVFPIVGAELSSASMYLVTLSGVTQRPTTDYVVNLYSYASPSIVFVAPPPLGVPITVRAFGYARGVNEGDTSLVTATGSTTARTLAERFADTISVKDFGAKNDFNQGTEAGTDNSAAFQAAFDYAQANRVAVFIPPGDYGFDSTLFVRSSMMIFGHTRSGQGSSQLVYRGTGPALKIEPWNGLAGEAYAVNIKNLGILTGGNGQIGIDATHLSDFLLDNVAVSRIKSYRWVEGIRLNAAGIVEMASPYITYAGIGINAQFGTDRYNPCAAWTISNGDFWFNDVAIRANNAIGWNIHGNWMEWNNIILDFSDAVASEEIESHGVWFHNNTISFSSSTWPDHLLLRVKTTGTKRIALDGVRFEDNDVFYAGFGGTSTTHPIVVDVSASTDPSSAIRLRVAGNRVLNGGVSPGALIWTNSAVPRIDVGTNRYISGEFNGGQYVELPLYTGPAQFSGDYVMNGERRVLTDISLVSPDAAAASPAVSSPSLRMRGTYWNAGAVAESTFTAQNVVISPAYSQFQLSFGGSLRAFLDSGGNFAADRVMGGLTANSSLTLAGGRDAADLGSDVIVDSNSARTAGALLLIRNQGAARASVNHLGGVSPGSPLGVPTASAVYMGAGVPSDANGNSGDFYFRTDATGTANQRVYVKAGGAWVGIL